MVSCNKIWRIDVLSKEEIKEQLCNYCCGAGDIITITLDPFAEKPCPVCGGKGKVPV